MKIKAKFIVTYRTYAMTPILHRSAGRSNMSPLNISGANLNQTQTRKSNIKREDYCYEVYYQE